MGRFDVDDFQRDVVERSHAAPVLVDFWAEWCGPCRVLGPLLERLADEAAGSWQLAKVDTEKYPELAAKHGIRGIPACKLFVDGMVADEFVGALPEPALRQWLEKALPSPQRGLLQQAAAAIERGDDDAARALLAPMLEAGPQDDEARIMLARAELFHRPELARQLADPVSMGSERADDASSILEIARALLDEAAGEPLPEGRGQQTFSAGRAALRQRDMAAALDAFIEVVGVDRDYSDGAARRLCLAIFRLLGEADDITRSRRMAFSSALYA